MEDDVGGAVGNSPLQVPKAADMHVREDTSEHTKVVLDISSTLCSSACFEGEMKWVYSCCIHAVPRQNLHSSESHLIKQTRPDLHQRNKFQYKVLQYDHIRDDMQQARFSNIIAFCILTTGRHIIGGLLRWRLKL